jgi:flavin reductase (DIM6/NTAB) family NADH-FMN oxidoreductase RutF
MVKIHDPIDQMKRIEGSEIAALLNPRAALLVTCCDTRGVPNVLTIAWHTPLSHNPPLVGISIAQRRYSHLLIQQVGEFVLNVVSMDYLCAVRICGELTGQGKDKFQEAGLCVMPSAHVRPPNIAGALAHLECVLVDQVETGDHTFFIGKVLHAEARAACFDDAWDSVGGDVLLCLQRDRFAGWIKRAAD